MSSLLTFPSLRCPVIEVNHLDASEYVDMFIGKSIPRDVLQYIEDLGLTSKQWATIHCPGAHAMYLSMAEYITRREWDGARVTFIQSVWLLAYEIEKLFKDGYFNV